MIRRAALGASAAIVFVVLPALGNLDALAAPQLWIMVVFGVVGSVLQPGYNPFTIAGKQGDRGTGLQIVWSVYLSQFAAIVEALYLRYPRSLEWDAVAGVALVAMAAGLALRTWAVLTLDRLFTMHVAVHSMHTLVRSGPYRIVRHPSYLGAFVMYTATTVFLHAWVSLGVSAAFLAVAYVRRIAVEENMLAEKFGAEYRAYRAEVPRLLPFLW